MIRKIPLPWMVVMACFMMAGILCLEYVRLMFYPTKNIGMIEIQNVHFYNLWSVGREVEDCKKQALDQISTERKILSSDQPHILPQNWTVYNSKYAMNWTEMQLPVIQRPEVAVESSPPRRSRGLYIVSERDKHTNSLNEEVAHYIDEVVGDREDRPEVEAVVEMIGRKIQDVQGGLEVEKEVQRDMGPSMEREYENRFAKRKHGHFHPRERGQPIHHKNRRNSSEQSFGAISFSEFQQRLHSISDVLSSYVRKYQGVMEKDTAKPLLARSGRRVWNPSIRRVSISEDLLRLRGIVIPASPSLEERGWPMWINTTELNSHLPDLMEVVKQVEAEEEERGVHDDVVKVSLNPDIVARGKFQQNQVEQFCRRGNYLSILPSNPEDLSTLFTHLLYDDSKKIVFCYVPKNGCSNMKRLLLILNGILAPESAQQKRPAEEVLKEVKSFKNLTFQGALHRLRYYYKFAIVRHPLERLLSAYRNKLEPRLIYEQRKHFPANTQAFILSHFRREEYQAWLSSWHTLRNSSQAADIHPTFQEFVEFMALFPLNEYNEHFSPFLELCHPCAIHYDFYANFKTLHYDLHALMNYLSIPPSYYPSITSYHSTRLLVKEYFGQLSNEDKRHLYHTLHRELDFYGSLHPEEQYSHNSL